MSQNFRGGGQFRMGPNPPAGTPQFRIGGPMTPVLRVFIYANIAIFVFTMLLTEQGRMQFFTMFGLVPEIFWDRLYIWQLVSFNFLHSGLSHIFFNLFALWVFGGELEKKFGSRRFAIFMAISGIGGGISMLMTSPGMQIPVVGASGIVYGVLLAYGLTYPNRIVYLYFLIPIKVKTLVIIFGGIEIISSISGSNTGVAHLAHLGGMVFGYLYLYYDKLYMKVRERYYRKKLTNLRKKYTIVVNKEDDEDRTYH